MPGYTAEQIERAENVDVRAFLEQTEGFTFTGRGRYLKCRHPDRTGQPSSLTIDTDMNRIFYNSVTGNIPLSAVDWCTKIREMDFPASMHLVLGELPQGERAEKPQFEPFHPVQRCESKREFRQPVRDEHGHGMVFDYLTKERGLSGHIVSSCIKHGIVYQDRYQNAVFAGFDDEDTMKYAARRSTFTKPEEEPFKKDAIGSDKTFAFKMVGRNTSVIYVTEAAIDAMSLATLEDEMNGKWSFKNKTYLSTGGAGIDKAIEQFCKTHEVKTINLCLDNDEAGRNGTDRIMKKFQEMGYKVNDMHASYAHDYNDELLAYRESPEAYQEHLASLDSTPFQKKSGWMKRKWITKD